MLSGMTGVIQGIDLGPIAGGEYYASGGIIVEGGERILLEETEEGFVFGGLSEAMDLRLFVELVADLLETATHVKVLVTPGIVQGIVPREYGYRYDVVSGRKELLAP